MGRKAYLCRRSTSRKQPVCSPPATRPSVIKNPAWREVKGAFGSAIMDITIRTAAPDQAADLSAIALSAKGYWGYSSEQLDLWKSEFLTISPEYIEANRVWVASVDSLKPVGFAAIEQHGQDAILEHLWVLPDYIGKGIGRRLFLHVAATIPRF